MVVIPDIAKIMSSEGPIIKAVVLKENGEMEEVSEWGFLLLLSFPKLLICGLDLDLSKLLVNHHPS